MNSIDVTLQEGKISKLICTVTWMKFDVKHKYNHIFGLEFLGIIIKIRTRKIQIKHKSEYYLKKICVYVA